MRGTTIGPNTEGLRGERGSIIVTFALMLIVMLGFVGLGIEVGRWYMLRAELSKSVDAAALAAAKNISNPNVDPVTLASEFCDQNFPPGGFGTPGSGSGTATFVVQRVGNDRVRVNGNVSASAVLTRLFGFTQIPISSAGMAQQRPVEIMLVLDRSGSMRAAMPDLQDAAKSFLDHFQDTQDKDKIGLISFATTVRVHRPPDTYFIAPLKTEINGLVSANYTNWEDALDHVDGPGGLTDQTGVPDEDRIPQFLIFFSDGVPTASRNFYRINNQIVDAVITVSGTGGPDDQVHDELYDPLAFGQVPIAPVAGNSRALPTGDGILPGSACGPGNRTVRWNIFDTHPVPGFAPDHCTIPNGVGQELGRHLVQLNRVLAIEHAQVLKGKRITIYTIGLGDVDPSFLEQVASGPALALYTPNSSELQALFNQVAQDIRLRLVQ